MNHCIVILALWTAASFCWKIYLSIKKFWALCWRLFARIFIYFPFELFPSSSQFDRPHNDSYRPITSLCSLRISFRRWYAMFHVFLLFRALNFFFFDGQITKEASSEKMMFDNTYPAFKDNCLQIFNDPLYFFLIKTAFFLRNILSSSLSWHIDEEYPY